MYPNLAGAGLQYILHYGIWHSLGRPRPHDVCIALVYHIIQVIVSLPQVTGHNIPTSFLPSTKDHSADSSVFSGMRLHTLPIHILIANSNDTVHFIKKLTFRDHGTIMIISYYEKYYGVITITSYYETYYGIITIRYILSLLYQEMLGLSRRNPQGNPQGILPKFIPLLTARMLLNIYASQTKHFKW